jgi:arylsulfatase A-like enzyme
MPNVSRRDFLKWAAAGAAAAAVMPRALMGAAGSGGAGQRASGPNIVYIMSDDHAAHAISAYGSRINKTPNIDRIAAEGMKLNNCFCTNSLCGPSRAVIITGKYSHKNGFYTNESGDRFDGSQPTVAKMLQAAGWQTAMIGKWHLVSDPTGFDYWHILPGQGVYHNPPMIEMGQKVQHTGYVTDIIADLSMDWMKKRDKNRPFFLMCHNKAPHRNWQTDEKHAHMYENDNIPLPDTFWDDYSNRSEAAADAKMRMSDLGPSDLKKPIPAGLDKKQETIWRYQQYIKDYLRCIASVDDNVGRILKFLDDEGLTDNTIIIYTSDQGFYLGDHNWFDKRFMFDPSLRMPFVVRHPGHIKPGSVSDDLCVNIDFAPTFLDCAGLPADKDMDGASMRGVLEGRTPADWRTSMYYHYYEYPGSHSVKRHFGVRTKRHKLIHYYYNIDAWELFDLEKDPNELKSVYGDPAYAAVQAEMLAELNRLQAKYGDSLEKALERVKSRPVKAGKAKQAGKQTNK